MSVNSAASAPEPTRGAPPSPHTHWSAANCLTISSVALSVISLNTGAVYRLRTGSESGSPLFRFSTRSAPTPAATSRRKARAASDA